MSTDSLEDKVRAFLKLMVSEKKLKQLYSFKINPPKDVDRILLLKILKEPFLIEYDSNEGRLYFLDSSGEKQYCPDIVAGITDSRDWISEFLPTVPFDIEQGGNLRKASEAEDLYKCILVAGILQGPFLDGFMRVLDSYDFNRMASSDDEGGSFSELIKKWQNLQNITVRVIVSGANYKISSEKRSEVGFVIGSLNREETIGVVSIRIRVKNIIRRFMEGQLSQSKVKQLTRIERLKLIQQKDDEVLAEINSSHDYSELYKICDLNADYLDATTKLILTESSEKFARENVGKIFADDESGFNSFVSKCRRRAFKEAVISLKEAEVENWRKVGNSNYVLASKR